MKNILGEGNLLNKCINTTLFVVIFSIFIASSLSLFDLSEGRFVLDMDQRISYDGLFSIFHSTSIEELIRNLTTGYDQDLRYGRGFWNLTSIFVFPFYVLFGVPGQIIATRVFGLLAMTASYFIFTRISINNRSIRLITIISLMLTTTHIHYIANPKPEPLLLLFLSIFFSFYAKRKYEFGWWFAILGFAWGIKISIAPIVAIVFIFSSVVNLRRNRKVLSLVNQLAKSSTYFLVGWIICSPVLFIGLWPIVFLFLLVVLITNYLSLRNLQENLRLGFAWFFVALLSIGAITFGLLSSSSSLGFLASIYNSSKDKLKLWFAFVSGESHLGGANLESIRSWFDLVNQEFFSGFGFIFVGMYLIAAYWLFKEIATKQFFKHDDVFTKNSNLFLILGTVSIVSIFISVTRLWDFYLHPGLVMLIIGIVGIYSNKLELSTKKSSGSRLKLEKVIYAFVLSLFFIVLIFPIVPKATQELLALSSRTHEEQFIEGMKDHEILSQLFETKYQQNDEQVRVAYDPTIFIPDASNKLLIAPIWSDFQNWQENYDFLVFGQFRLEWFDNNKEIPKEFAKHMIMNNQISCDESPCYKVGPVLPSGGLVFSKLY